MAEPAPQGSSEARLPPGRHGLPRTYVAENQRERLLNGVVEAVAEHGYRATTIARISEAAKISRRTFYEHFEDKDACFLAAHEMVDAHVRSSMLEAPGAEAPWPERVRARLAALLDVLARDPAVARFYMVEPLAAGGEIAARHRESMQLIAQALRPEPPPSELDLEVRDQALVGGLAALITRRLNAGAADRLPELLPDLVALSVAPFLGLAEARRVAHPEPQALA
ncbi:MAG TPA: TetR/AcrR family transcriptional regulator [Solirubrobacterales bacterium]|nr:TetR/AcrR family transcriptional regulator [Solirubrobacterales bacterium]